MLKRYDIVIDVKAAGGTQTFKVLAESEEDALEVFEAEGGVYVESEVEVTDLETPTLSNVELFEGGEDYE